MVHDVCTVFESVLKDLHQPIMGTEELVNYVTSVCIPEVKVKHRREMHVSKEK